MDQRNTLNSTITGPIEEESSHKELQHNSQCAWLHDHSQPAVLLHLCFVHYNFHLEIAAGISVVLLF